MGEQHELVRIPDVAPVNDIERGRYKDGSLGRALEQLARKGDRVLDFWRDGRSWIVKLMRRR